MKSSPFDYARPKTVAEASALLAQDGVTTAAIAGGQSLLPMLNLRVAQIDLLVDLSRLDELKAVSETPTSLQIGALTSHAVIEDGKVPDLFSGLMRRVAGTISYRAVRNHGTIGGSVALADPAADWPGCLIALSASVRIAGRNGTRIQPMADFVQGSYSTSLAPGEIILGFDVPRLDSPLRWGFAKVVRKSGAFANSIAYVVARSKDGPISVVLAAAGSRPIILTSTARQIANRTGSEDALRITIAEDLKTHLRDADDYQQRLHTATVMRAAKEMRAQQ
jgi:aerobic carbon-monoxide dehydrogenase medium subunit